MGEGQCGSSGMGEKGAIKVRLVVLKSRELGPPKLTLVAKVNKKKKNGFVCHG